jgi:hypothetical protein
MSGMAKMWTFLGNDYWRLDCLSFTLMKILCIGEGNQLFFSEVKRILALVMDEDNFQKLF